MADPPPQADLAIIKSDVPDPIAPGAEMVYLLTVVNLGEAPASNVVLSDALPAEAEFLNAFPDPDSVAGQSVTWTLGELGPEGRSDVYVVVRIRPGSEGVIANRAEVRTDSPESGTGNNSVLEETTIAPDVVPLSESGHRNCTFTQGYWKNHPDRWPVASLMLGSVTYNKAQLIAILNQPPRGNGLVILARQLIAAKLNVANGASASAISDKLTQADQLIGSQMIPPVGNDSLDPDDTSSLADMLAMYNEGGIGPGHCDDHRDKCRIECPEDIVTSSTPGVCGAVVDYMAFVTGFCPDTTVVCTPPPGSFFDVGPTRVTCQVLPLNSHGAGIQGGSHSEPEPLDECRFWVKVVDAEPPQVVCPPDVTTTATACGTTASVMLGTPSVTDNCDPDPKIVSVERSDGQPLSAPYPLGTTTVTWTVKDKAKNTTTCSTVVTVEEGVCPQPIPCMLECPSDIWLCAPKGECEVAVDYTVNTVGDCEGTTIICTPPSGSLFSVGTTTVTCVLVPLGGEVGIAGAPQPVPPLDECTFTVTVRDEEKPVIDCPEDIVTEAEQGRCDALVRYQVDARDRCSTITEVFCWPPSGHQFPVGMTTVVCIAEDLWGNSAYCTFKVTVLDTQPPAITCPADVETTAGICETSATVILGRPTATDNCDPAVFISRAMRSDGKPITDPFPLGETLVTWTAMDDSGNTATCTTRVTVHENVCPQPGDCVFTQGFWKNHPDAWPVTSLFLGTVEYDQEQLLAIFNTPPAGNGILILAHQLIATKLNIALGADPTTIQAAVMQADTKIGGMVIPPFGDGFLSPMEASEVAGMLADYNEGLLGPPHCDDPRDECLIECPDDIVTTSAPGLCGAFVDYMAIVTGFCPGTTVTCTPPPGSFFPVGEHVVTCQVVPLENNHIAGENGQPVPVLAECRFRVIVRDGEPPVIQCPPDMEATAVGCDTTASVPIEVPPVTDNCDPDPEVTVIRSDDQPLTAPFPLGMTTVIMLVQDEAGNHTRCTFKVTVNPGECPQPFPCEIECPDNITVDADPKKCGQIVTYDVDLKGDCEGTTVVCTYPSGTLFPIGTTLVTCRIVLLGEGAASVAEPQPLPQTQCSFTVTVLDKEPPRINCPPDITVDVEPGKCDKHVSYTVTAQDPCTDTVWVMCYPPSGSRFPVGMTNVVCTATDGSGNKASCTFKVTVRDKEPPRITCPPDVTVMAEGCNTTASVPLDPPTAEDDCTSGVVISAASRSDGQPLTAPFPLGTTFVTWTATDEFGNSASCTTKVKVNPGDCPLPCPEPPQIICPDDIRVDAEPGHCDAVVEYETTVTDDCTSDLQVVCNLPSGSRFPVGTSTVFCVVTDDMGAIDTCSFQVTVRDRTPPRIICPPDITVDASDDCCDAVVNYDVTVTDDCTTDVHVICTPPSGSTFPIGTTPVVCIATDGSGNTSRCSFTVTVRDTQPPQIICPWDMIVDACPNCCEAQVDYMTTATDNCPDGLMIFCTPEPGSIFPLGLTQVTCTAVDKAGNESSCSFFINVCDHQPPTITCPSDIAVMTSDCADTARVSLSRPTASDNCTSMPLITRGVRSDNKGLDDPYPLGTTTITWAAVDEAGNVATCTSRVIVMPGPCVPCTVTCPANITVNTEPGQPDAAVSFSPRTSGNCNGLAISSVPSSGSRFPIGTTPVNVTYSVPGKGAYSCSFTVTVLDNQAPTITCPSAISVTAGQCETSANVTVPQPMVSDNSGQAPTVTASRSDGAGLSDPYPQGTTVVTFTATDAAGNSASCMVQVTVTPGPCAQPAGGCTQSLVYWKDNPDAWPVQSLTLGNRLYTKNELLAILNQPSAGNRLVRLAHQLIPAKLNVANGADSTAVSAVIAQADALIGNLVVPPVGSGNLQAKYSSAIHITLGQYNAGMIGPGHCD